MLTINRILSSIEKYSRDAGHPPARIAMTPSQMDEIRKDALSKTAIEIDSEGMPSISGVRIEIWGSAAK